MTGVSAKAGFSFGVFVCLVVVLCHGSLEDDPCDSYVERYTLELYNLCVNGTVTWNHPRGTLRLAMDRGSQIPFAFCMVQTMPHFKLTDVTDGRNVTMKLPRPGHPSCIKSFRGKVFVDVKTMIPGIPVTHMEYSAPATE